jgi:hypothetical protein
LLVSKDSETDVRNYNVLNLLNFNNIMNNYPFQIIFWFKAFVLVLMYANGIKAAIQVSHPTYYKPHKWLRSL